MALTESIKESKARYKKMKRETLAVEVPKGKRAAYQSAAKEMGMAFTQLIQIAVEEYIRNHANNVPDFPEEEFLTERETLVIERFVRLSANTQLDFLHLMDDFLEPFAPQENEGGENEQSEPAN